MRRERREEKGRSSESLNRRRTKNLMWGKEKEDDFQEIGRNNKLGRKWETRHKRVKTVRNGQGKRLLEEQRERDVFLRVWPARRKCKKGESESSLFIGEKKLRKKIKALSTRKG